VQDDGRFIDATSIKVMHGDLQKSMVVSAFVKVFMLMAKVASGQTLGLLVVH
jgi:hypothetical protein